MSLLRAAAIARPRAAANVSCIARRNASSHAHDEHHHDAHHDEHAIAYPKETFGTTWMYGAAFAAGLYVWYKFAPAPGDEPYLTRLVGHYGTPVDVWQNINASHLKLISGASDDALLQKDAKRPVVHRFRYPQSFEQASPHLQIVGQSVDLEGLVVKND